MEIIFKDTKINFEVFGESNEIFVFLHGWGANSSFMTPLAKVVGIGKTCVLIDFPPFGNSSEPQEPWKLDDYVNLTAEILNKVSNSIGKNCFVSAIFAHSFGGRVAIKGISNKKFESRRLILLSSAGIRPKFSFKTKFRILQYKFYKKIGSKKANEFGSPDYKVLSPVMKQTFKSIVSEDLSKEARKITAKTLIVFGKDDKETPPYMAKKLSKLIPKSKLFLLEKAGHFAYLTSMEKVVPIILAFLELTS